MSQPGRHRAHASDESAGGPDDHLFVRPYVASPGAPSRSSATPAWPHSGPLLFPDPEPSPRPAPSAAAAAPASRGAGRRGGGPAATVATLLGLAAAGGIVLVLTGSEPEPPPRSGRPPELSVPVLPARSPGAGEPGPDASGRSAAPSAKASASASPGASTPAAGQSSKPPSPSAAAGRLSVPAATLRMGDRGPEVRALQELLFGQGFTYVSVTGVYDGQTKRGVSQLQRDRDIKGDPAGVYGPATQAALD
ncbi:peptidoglycan-binding domain-containing protein [Streptomyces sp. NPDC048349]|uniref:peptidoglycan-binding domain-containing protein n=1 Tax=Streptomyces sp. NPDC048349 TaxID=3155486 RepID=UPI00343FBB31